MVFPAALLPMPAQEYLILDYETFSEADLKRCGAYEYAVHPSTEILCAAWRVGTRETICSSPINVWLPSSIDFGLFNALTNTTIKLVAHNAFFEQVITEYVLKVKDIPIERWICTAARAAALALPRSLEGAGEALGLKVQKDQEGKRLMLKMSKPRKPTKNDTTVRHTDAKDLKRLIDYCVTDIAVETELLIRLPPLTPLEERVWALDQKINHRGFLVDRSLVDSALKLIAEETKALNAAAATITNGKVSSGTQRNAMLEWLNARGLGLPDLRAKTVHDVLANGVKDEKAKKILEIRQAGSKTSTAKYEAFKIKSGHDGRVRDNLLYHGATTGRWGGRGVQPQNFPRGTIKCIGGACDDLKTFDLDTIRMLWGNPLDVLSSCLRGVIIAPPGKEFYCADYAAIEARVLFWLADHKSGLKAYRENRDIYREMASVIYGKPLATITKDQRDMGKRAILGCGYGMGHNKFLASCKQYGQEIDEQIAFRAVNAYRKEHHPVPSFWYATENAAAAAVENPGKSFKCGKVTWFVSGDFLYCRLPSFRKLAYYRPKIVVKDTPWGEKKATVSHMAVDSLTKKWGETSVYGGLLVENVTQAVARDLLAEGMLRIEKAGYQIVLTVHDEILAERKTGEGNVEEFCKLMSALPVWAAGCPVAAEGWAGNRYKK